MGKVIYTCICITGNIPGEWGYGYISSHRPGQRSEVMRNVMVVFLLLLAAGLVWGGSTAEETEERDPLWTETTQPIEMYMKYDPPVLA